MDEDSTKSACGKIAHGQSLASQIYVKMPNTEKSIIVWLVTCLKCRAFTLKSDPVRSFHSLEIAFCSKIMMFLAFFESLFLQIASRHIIWNMVIAHEDLSSCFLLPFITLKLEVVAIFVIENLWKLQLQVPGTSWSALKLRQVEWPYWIIRRRRTVTREHNIYYLFMVGCLVGWLVGWWFQIYIFLMFIPKIGVVIQFDKYFSNGLKPPTRFVFHQKQRWTMWDT